MRTEEIKQKLCDCIDSYEKEVVGWEDYLMKHPELGFQEKATSAFIRSKFDELGLKYTYPLALTGIKAKAKGAESRLNVCLIGEMDAVVNKDHPQADPETGAAHACGHNVQITQLLGAAYGLLHSEAMEQLFGDVTFFAVPAEEFVELEKRDELRRAGKIRCFGGKQELIRIGAFDDVDLAIMIHSQAGAPEIKLFTRGSSLGFLAKRVRFIGKATHASTPFDGVNALNAASLALAGINANRETFRDEDKIRIHPIVTRGGDLVNIVPADVRVETYVRGASSGAILSAAGKVDRSVLAGAYAVGARAEIETEIGYLPLNQDASVSAVMETNARSLWGPDAVTPGTDMVGSTDMGDLSQLIPCVQPTMGGFTGSPHGKDFHVTDPSGVCLGGAKLLAMTAVDLLCEGARRGLEIRENFHPKLSRQEYLDYLAHEEKTGR